MSDIFATVPKDHLALYKENKIQGNRIAHLLSFNQADISKATGVPKSNIRYDEGRMPSELRNRIIEWATILNLVAGYFNGDEEKTIQWFMIPNPFLGGISPRDMIKLGRYNKLIKYVINALAENIP